jgi:hypothetical protein
MERALFPNSIAMGSVAKPMAWLRISPKPSMAAANLDARLAAVLMLGAE